MSRSTFIQEKSASQRLIEAYKKTFERTEQLFDLITDEAYFARPISLRHPINFYEGHLPAFLWNTLFKKYLGKPSLNPDFDQLFERGIDPKDQQMANALTIQAWPSRDEVRVYKHKIHQQLFEFLETQDLNQFPQLFGREGCVLWLILEHEMMHQETLLYMFHQLPAHLKKKPHFAQNGHQHKQAPEPYMVNIPAGLAQLGAVPDTQKFVWDNELPVQDHFVPAFEVDAFNITNGQFLTFIEADGYNNPAFWTDKTWQWKCEQKKAHPEFWKNKNGTWMLRDFFEDIPLPLDWPVYVTHAEASAYARFVNKALPTEAEWQRVAYGHHHNGVLQGNIDFKQWSPVPVGAEPEAVNGWGVHDLIGNGWEWTSTPFAPLDGFTPSDAYPQYSADFFEGDHYVVKGGSHFTDARLIRPSFRNWYYWHYPYMYATFRCVKRS